MNDADKAMARYSCEKAIVKTTVNGEQTLGNATRLHRFAAAKVTLDMRDLHSRDVRRQMLRQGTSCPILTDLTFNPSSYVLQVKLLGDSVKKQFRLPVPIERFLTKLDVVGRNTTSHTADSGLQKSQALNFSVGHKRLSHMHILA